MVGRGMGETGMRTKREFCEVELLCSAVLF